MDLGHCERDGEPTEVEDPDTGQRYLMYRLPIGSWPTAPLFVYECQVCRGRFEPAEWGRGCPGCAGEKKKGKRRRKRR